MDTRIPVRPKKVKVSLNTFLHMNNLRLDLFKTIDHKFGVSIVDLNKHGRGLMSSVVAFDNTLKLAFNSLMVSLDKTSGRNYEYDRLTKNGNPVFWPDIYLNWPEMKQVLKDVDLSRLKA